MKKYILLPLLAAILFCLPTQAQKPAKMDKDSKKALAIKYKSEMIKKEAPAFSLINLEGEMVSLADFKGKIVILDFWATWCSPCKAAFPGMQATVNKYKDDPKVVFLFIDTKESNPNYKKEVTSYIQEMKFTFNVLFDEMIDRSKSTANAYSVGGIPAKFVIDRKGFIRFISSGGSADIEALVHEMSNKIELARKG